MINLTTKERLLLEDEKEQEKICVNKYKDYSSRAQDPELKNLFAQLSQKEQEHLDTINQMLNGVVPNINQNQGQQQASQQASMNIGDLNLSGMKSSSYNEHDKMLCSDSLSTEKFISSTYNTAIFEFTDKNARQVLNHIQKEEQEHGEKIYNYMAAHGMYNVQ